MEMSSAVADPVDVAAADVRQRLDVPHDMGGQDPELTGQPAVEVGHVVVIARMQYQEQRNSGAVDLGHPPTLVEPQPLVATVARRAVRGGLAVAWGLGNDRRLEP